jgi:choline kinase/phosphatidylglycerophosphate synthase
VNTPALSEQCESKGKNGNDMIKKALIIAAGQGSRLRKNGKDTPKPLQKVAGVPLLKRILLTSIRSGINEFVIVVGYRKNEVVKAVQAWDLGARISFVENPDWKKPNGYSVLAAKAHLKENFVLMMSDHIFSQQTLEALCEAPLRDNEALLAVDYNITGVFDLDDATKVVVHNQKVQDIHKKLTRYNAVDTGMFLASPALFDVLEKAIQTKEGSLSDAVGFLALENKMGAFDIGKGFWQDVDTPETLKHAEKILINACRKPTDGVISRNINRPISLFISRLLVKTGLSANHVTGLTTLVGILSGVFVARGDYLNALIGAFLFNLASILDGCDGEISKLKLTDSKLGQWLDTLSDNTTYLCFFVGVVVGVAGQGSPHIFISGGLALFGLLMSLAVMFFYLIRNTKSGSLLAVQKDFQTSTNGRFLKRFFRSIQFMVKRDFFALLFLVLAAFNQLEAILWIIVVGANLVWMVLMSTKLGLFKAPPSVVEESVQSHREA